MRDIKFRSFEYYEEKGRHVIRNFEQIKSSCLQYVTNNIAFDKREIMQYIGLKDKNGTEIYEGDILKSTTKLSDYYEVYYSDGGFKYRNKSNIIDLSFADHNHLEKILSILEVVGNIYETPEILK